MVKRSVKATTGFSLDSSHLIVIVQVSAHFMSKNRRNMICFRGVDIVVYIINHDKNKLADRIWRCTKCILSSSASTPVKSMGPF